MADKNCNDGWLQYNADMDEYEQLRDDVLKAAEEAGLSAKHLNTLELGVEEIAVNIISYAYENGGPIWVRALRDGGLFRLEFVDHGKLFNPLAEDMRPTDGVPTVEQDEGGYGIFLVRQFFASVSYKSEEMFGKMSNHMTMELLV